MQHVHSDPHEPQPQRLLDQSRLRADALRVNEFKVDLALLTQRHSSLAASTKLSYDRYQEYWAVRNSRVHVCMRALFHNIKTCSPSHR